MAEDDLTSNTPIVIDNGSGFIKAGLAGEQDPKVTFPNLVGRKKHELTMSETSIRRGVARSGARAATKTQDEFFVGPHAMDMRGVLKLSYAMDHSSVVDWNDMSAIWSYLYTNQLRLSSEEHPVLVTEAPFRSLKERQRTAEIFFEKLNVPALCFSMQAVLSLYALQKTTGVVLDSGDGVTQCVPVFEGFPIQEAITRVDIGGRQVTECLQTLLRKAGYVFHTTADREIVREMKEKLCYVSKNAVKEEEASRGVEERKLGEHSFDLPDGNTVSIGPERFRAPEILFRPSLIGSEYLGVDEMVTQSIGRCGLDMRATLYSEIVLSGGNTLTLGFADRLFTELVKVAPPNTKVRIFASPDRHKQAWVGGSILASLDTFKSMLTTRQEFEEDGMVIHKRTL